jgi:hypothetical protein
MDQLRSYHPPNTMDDKNLGYRGLRRNAGCPHSSATC